MSQSEARLVFRGLRLGVQLENVCLERRNGGFAFQYLIRLPVDTNSFGTVWRKSWAYVVFISLHTQHVSYLNFFHGRT